MMTETYPHKDLNQDLMESIGAQSNESHWRGSGEESPDMCIYHKIFQAVLDRDTTTDGNLKMNYQITDAIVELKDLIAAENNIASMNYSFWNTFNLSLLDSKNLLLLHGSNYDSNNETFKQKLLDLIYYRLHQAYDRVPITPTVGGKPARITDISDSCGDGSETDSPVLIYRSSSGSKLNELEELHPIQSSNIVQKQEYKKTKTSILSKIARTAATVALASVGGWFIYKRVSDS